MKDIKKLKYHLLLISIVLFLSFSIAIQKGSQAYSGISWGSSDIISNIVYKFPQMCEVNKLDQYCRVNKNEVGVNFGVYDFEDLFPKDIGLAIDHYFIDWVRYDSKNLTNKILVSAERNRWPLITVEPFIKDNKSSESLFSDIIRGEYDEEIERFCVDLNTLGKPTFIRWGHEMDNLTGRYAWASEDSDGYKLAYNYFVNKCKELNKTETYYIWSPVGNNGLESYWPGDDNVDYVGVSVYSFDEYEIDNLGKRLSFSDIFNEKYERVQEYNKPIIIAEMGVNGNDTYQRMWMYDAYRSFSNFPLLKTVVYFNAKDSPEAWGKKYSVPDWRIDSDIYRFEN